METSGRKMGGGRIRKDTIDRGTHQGELMGIAPTEKQIELKGITIHRFEGDKIAEEWERYDNLGLMQQLGVVGEPGPTGL